ncbi:hypothetical protein C0Q70_10650 [Pomacea canaliculata]|uniref:FAD-binding domain-containing protein n=1 Tax=Pomacea canaliculata TaxID=400727 RepID=A0A2T7P3S8_POMCA|nr:hypothetical protein C0Q70_10650 [Pomacea canaliculata]
MATMSAADPEAQDKVEAAFKQFFTADSCESICQSFKQLLQATGIQGQAGDQRVLYTSLRNKLQGYYKAQELLKLLDKKVAHPVYKQGKACTSTKVLIVGAGPCGLRVAIECALLGAPTVVVEKRGTFFPQQRAAPVALPHHRPPEPGRQTFLPPLLRRQPRSHQ